MTHVMRHLVFAGLIVCGTVLAWGQTPQGDLPKVVLVGDSIRMSYAPLVEKELAGKAVIISARPTAATATTCSRISTSGSSASSRPSCISTAGSTTQRSPRPRAAFRSRPRSTRRTCGRSSTAFAARPRPWCCSPRPLPSSTDRAAATRGKADYALLEASIEQYNAIALKVMQELQVPIDDLHAVFPDAASRSEALAADGVHFTAAGQLGLAKAVAAAVAQAPARPEQELAIPVRDSAILKGGA